MNHKHCIMDGFFVGYRFIRLVRVERGFITGLLFHTGNTLFKLRGSVFGGTLIRTTLSEHDSKTFFINLIVDRFEILSCSKIVN